MALIDSLDALVSDLSDRGSPLAGYLRPGLSRHDINREAEQRDATLHPDVVALFGWHDGFDVERWPGDALELALFPGFEFRSLGHALDQFELNRSLAGDQSALPGGLAQDEVWAATWFPIAATDGRTLFISANEADYGSVWYDPVRDEKVRIFDSLSDALDSVRSKLRAGSLTVSSGGAIRGEWISQLGPG